jgi:F0F1-type ATP synthase assembly protein I
MEQARSMHAVNNAAKLPPHLGAPMVITALAVGVVADLLLRVTPWGLNVTLVAGLAGDSPGGAAWRSKVRAAG